MTPRAFQPLDARWVDEIAAFLADKSPTRNPRSVTAMRTVDGGLYHFKHARISLADEARALALAASVGEVSGVRSITLEVFDPRANVLVTEGERGESLFNSLWNESSRLALAPQRRHWPEVLGRLAAWLAAFHRASDGSDACRRHSPEDCLERLRLSFRSKLAIVRESRAAPLSRSEVDRILDYVEGGLDPDLWRGEAICQLHGDLVPVNQLLLADGSIRVLDFGDSVVGFALEDLVRLWSGVWELTQCGRRRARLLRPALSRILADYSRSPRSSDSRPFMLLRVWNAVTQACVACTNRSTFDLSTALIHRRLTRAAMSWLRREVLS